MPELIMGASLGVICKDCGTGYRVSSGGGFIFHKLHCDQCGKEKDVLFMEIEDLHSRYLKGLKVPYSTATLAHDKYVQENYKGEPISAKEYYKEIENYAGKCDCGGNYTFDAASRCPNCKSTNYEPTGDLLLYD